MSDPIRELPRLLSSLRPERQPGVWAYATCADDGALAHLRPVAIFREAEATTAIVREDDARAAGLEPLFVCAWITLSVHSDLQAIGMTAAVASALAARGIACNIVAAAYHDHLFVPLERADDAMCALHNLQRDASERAASTPDTPTTLGGPVEAVSSEPAQ